ncbi:MAG: acyltransferase [Dysgonamonadaceae bacterium]|jgi:peptidoglycan/LPS O-acetylase OafA/YrhL|nr:acyltransferase [Dysgonamonadaceae bacterium]
MPETKISAATFPDSKPHYEILDGLRGVAAVMVVIFHIFEFHTITREENFVAHGYLAVDFFYALSGFVIAYAYDDRWKKRPLPTLPTREGVSGMSIWAFVKRRLIRLHPMVVFGTLVGTLLFYLSATSGVPFDDGGTSFYPLVSQTPWWALILAMLAGMLMLPTPPALDYRGIGEMYALNSPAWSLFFEYIANLLYGLFVRRFSKTMLSVLVALSAGTLLYFSTFHYGNINFGWQCSQENLLMGIVRVMYPFFAGVLLYRLKRLTRVKNGFLWCSLILVVMLAVPPLASNGLYESPLWINGLYESLTIIAVFPLIVYLGASSKVTGKYASKICKFLGEISFPLYMVHYPLMYVYGGWVIEKNASIADVYVEAILVVVVSVALAYAALKLYDEPLRSYLSKRFISNQKIEKQ